MRVWVDLSNSPHVPLFAALGRELEEAGHELVLTARDHAQTVELARRQWDGVAVVGGQSPAGRTKKLVTTGERAVALLCHARRERVAMALSHGSYAQLAAARIGGIPAVTMMDYEHQPANHVSFRLAQRVVVPNLFPADALRRCGGLGKAVRYVGFKEEAYLRGFRPDQRVLDELGVRGARLLVVMRPAPEGALYHRSTNPRFDAILDEALAVEGAQVVVLPRSVVQERRYAARAGVVVPRGAVDGRSLLALADVTVGAGGTMTRESALLGTPTYTVFAGALAAVDAELIRRGWLQDLRDAGTQVRFEPRPPGTTPPPAGPAPIVEAVMRALAELAPRARGQGSRPLSSRGGHPR